MAGKYDDRLKDYVQVNERIIAFYEKYPQGSLQSEITELTDARVVVKAWAYRDADDPRPGMGHSSLNIPGTTPYTRGSEVENAETSAWGRAIAALGFEVKKGIASREEVENKQEEAATPQNGSNASGRASTGGMEEAIASARRSLRQKAARILGGDEKGLVWLKEKGITGKTMDLKTLADASLELNAQFGSMPQDESTTQEDPDLNW